MVPPNNFFIMDLIETFHISRKWAFFGLLSHAFFPLPIHLLRENFDFECTNIIKHQFVLKSKKKKEFTVPWAQHFSSKQSSSWRYDFHREGEVLIGSLFDATLHRGRILLYLKFISMEEALYADRSRQLLHFLNENGKLWEAIMNFHNPWKSFSSWI